VQRVIGVQVLQEFERIGGPDYGNVGWEDLHMMFEEAAWFAETWSHAEPWIDEVATDTTTRMTFLRQNGIPARFVPLGYHAGWGEHGTRERDIDVLFIGDMRSPSREELVPEVLQRLRDWGFSTCERSQFPEGEERAELLQRARVVLNVLRLPWEFPGVRLFSSVACGALVVSNEAVQNEPFQPGLHFVPAPRKRMAEAIATLLDHEEDRAERAATALASMKRELSLELSLQRLLQPRKELAALARVA
jgi:glycosyltransferase involved in cell wall biosynthesis